MRLVAFASALLVAAAAHAAPRPATLDTLDVRAVLEARSAHLDSLLLPHSAALDTAGSQARADSLDRGGAAAVRAYRPADATPTRPPRLLRHGLRPLALTTYERVDGLRLGSGVEVRLGRVLEAQADAAYGFARHAWAGEARATLSRPRRSAGLEFGWSDLVTPFGPNHGEPLTSVAALVAGQDRQDYLRRRETFAGIAPWRARGRRLGVAWFARREWSVEAATDFHFAGGGTPMQEPNPAIDAGWTRGVRLDGVRAWRENVIRVGGAAGIAGGDLGGDFEFAWQEGGVAIAPVLRDGSVLRISVRGANTAGAPPVQAVPYLGGDGNLRGYERLEFAGRRRATARLDFEWGTDFLRYTRIPGVRRLGLQLVPHMDTGTTWGDARGVAGSLPSLHGGWRTSVGLGVQRNLYYPGIGRLRLDVTWRTDGRGDGPSYWFRIGEF